jgi:hypothetical protein
MQNGQLKAITGKEKLSGLFKFLFPQYKQYLFARTRRQKGWYNQERRAFATDVSGWGTPRTWLLKFWKTNQLTPAKLMQPRTAVSKNGTP